MEDLAINTPDVGALLIPFAALEHGANAVGKLGPEGKIAAPVLVDLLASAHFGIMGKDVRIACAQALGQIGPEAKSAVPALRLALDHEDDEKIRNAMRAALAKIDSGSPP